MDDFKWLNVPAEAAARRLLGCEIVSEVGGERVRARIVEVEAYDQADEASHSFRGPSKRNEVMFGPAGHLYVYFTYGMHYCCNIVCGAESFGSAVLIRAIEPLEGIDTIERRRGTTGYNLTNGPAKATQALGIDLSLNGHDLMNPPVRLIKRPTLPTSAITATTRIGISKAVHELRRFYISDSPYISER